MKVLDEQRRLFGLINPVDLIAIVFAIALALVLATVLLGRSPIGPDTADSLDTIEVVILGSTPNSDQLPISVGDTVSRFGGTGIMGEVASYTTRPGQRESIGPDGFFLTESLMATDVEIVVRGKGAINDTAVTIGGERIRHGQALEVLLPHFQMPGRIVSMQKVD